MVPSSSVESVFAAAPAAFLIYTRSLWSKTTHRAPPRFLAHLDPLWLFLLLESCSYGSISLCEDRLHRTTRSSRALVLLIASPTKASSVQGSSQRVRAISADGRWVDERYLKIHTRSAPKFSRVLPKRKPTSDLILSLSATYARWWYWRGTKEGTAQGPAVPQFHLFIAMDQRVEEEH
ncbi:hypothetical protein MSAN_01541400 [Mycena sanguinolenta]|uniref:Uncharacterized protein n=1 Tax=Mycena sanguinolenta TaxID=230812 RepID=A0A8H7CZV0_9AGAR|nr:hypothetical protein MSAN_01541400 [Mycena sanguinolenta]